MKKQVFEFFVKNGKKLGLDSFHSISYFCDLMNFDLDIPLDQEGWSSSVLKSIFGFQHAISIAHSKCDKSVT